MFLTRREGIKCDCYLNDLCDMPKILTGDKYFKSKEERERCVPLDKFRSYVKHF